MKTYGLIGYPLTHSFSQKYFEEKFKKEKIIDKTYRAFELAQIEEVDQLMSTDDICGFNVTSPYKEQVIPYLQALDESAVKVGAVNVVKRKHDNTWIGYNSDYYGFKNSLERWMPNININIKALVLGTGGASKAIIAVLKDLQIPFQIVSRISREDICTYEQLKSSDILTTHHLIINTTPLGTYPKVEVASDINYSQLTSAHYLYDLVYNPAITRFIANGIDQGSHTKNGLEMLELQAEKSWEIWTSSD